MNHLVHALPGSCSTFLVPAPKKIGTELKVVHGASTKWCVVLGAWPKTMVQNSTSCSCSRFKHSLLPNQRWKNELLILLHHACTSCWKIFLGDLPRINSYSRMPRKLGVTVGNPDPHSSLPLCPCHRFSSVFRINLLTHSSVQPRSLPPLRP